jgi:hypothetical protein
MKNSPKSPIDSIKNLISKNLLLQDGDTIIIIILLALLIEEEAEIELIFALIYLIL